MTWNTLTNLTAGDTLTAGEMDKIRENIEHLGAMKFADVALSSLTAISGARIAVGSYTGNAAATKAITGVGFQPKYVCVYSRDGTTTQAHEKTSGDTTYAKRVLAYDQDQIISLDSDGFTVGDGTGTVNYLNANTIVYSYIAIG